MGSIIAVTEPAPVEHYKGCPECGEWASSWHCKTVKEMTKDEREEFFDNQAWRYGNYPDEPIVDESDNDAPITEPGCPECGILYYPTWHCKTVQEMTKAERFEFFSCDADDAWRHESYLYE